MGNESNTTRETEFVFRRLEEALRFFGRETDARWFWILILAVVLGVGLVYVVWMYRKDSRTIGPAWAIFLGALRTLVYMILAAVFLLPAKQVWERTETRSKVIVALDVSGSMTSRDDLPTETISVDKLPTRQDKVISFLTDDQRGFLKGLEEKNPVYCYRFGNRADEAFRLLENGQTLSAGDWSTWLKPDPQEKMPDGATDEEKQQFSKRMELVQQLVNGTNVGGSLLDVFNREANNMVQGIVVISDGRSTEYSAQSLEDLRARARRAKVPLFTVVVGEHRQSISIRITDLQAPEQARPEDKFPVRIEVDGDGLPDREMSATLEITSPKGDTRTLSKAFKFNAGTAGPPHGRIEFEIEAAKFGTPPASGGKPELEEGNWTLQARVPKDKREIFLGKDHLSQKTIVHVIKKPLRVLLFANAPTHDYQFLRNLLVREVDQHRVELSICLQIQREGVVQDVAQERFLKFFPNRLGDEGANQAEDRYYNLAQYDLVIAYDPDWTQLLPEQLALLERWVNMQAGGLIFVAGPVNTYQLSRSGNRETMKPLLDLLPVTLQDSRLLGVSGMERSTNDPWALHFPGATAEMDFLKLDEEGKTAVAGWEEFFRGGTPGEATKESPVVRGFYSYYPVESAKPSATVVATFADPRARLRDGTREQPYLVIMPYGSGKVVYLGSGEVRRLRTYREIFFERFWTKLARYAGSGNLTRLSRHGILVMGQQFTAGQIVRLEAQLFGRDLLPLAPATRPRAALKGPPGVTMPPVELEARARGTDGGEWTGWFQGRFRAMTPGSYSLDLQIPESGDLLQHKFTVKEANPELDDTRPDFGQMYQLASDFTEVLPRLDRPSEAELRAALEGTAARLLQRIEEPDSPGAPKGRPVGETKTGENKDAPHLFFDLNSAHLIPRCLVTDTKIQRSRGPVKDLWDEGFTLSSDPLVQFANVLLIIVGLLSLEWLTRKLLKLA
jgi:hypothetical protein